MNIDWEKTNNRKSMKVTDFKTKELNENAMRRKKSTWIWKKLC